MKPNNVVSDTIKYKKEDVLEKPGDVFLKRLIKNFPNVAEIHYPNFKNQNK
jgi:hypothetical protein